MSSPIHPIDFQRHSFHPVIDLPVGYEVYDFTQGYDAGRKLSSAYGVGKYAEKRAGMYTTELFEGTRNIHVGIDLAAPVGTPIRAFCGGWIHLFGYNAAAGDYGYTVITGHRIDGVELYALHGHLAGTSIEGKKAGKEFKAGEVIAWIGDRHENGGWNPHLHFQLSFLKPEKPDLPGAVNEKDLEWALKSFPDPRLVLGPLY